MATFEQKERQALYALFTLDEHEIREGSTSRDGKKVQWFTYIRREAIIERLDSIFFGEWESGFINPMQPYTHHEGHVDCAMHLTIRGMRREYNGSQKLNYDRKAQKYTTGENDEKGAATDAFKRVASQWGIGLYLQQSPQIWTENYKDDSGNIDWKKKDKVQGDAMNQVSKWLKLLGATGDALRSDENDSTDENDSISTPQAATTGNAAQGSTPANVTTLPAQSTASGSDKSEWRAEIMNLTAFLYELAETETYDEFEHTAAVQERMNDTGDMGINPKAHTPKGAGVVMIAYHAMHKLRLTKTEFPQALGGKSLTMFVNAYSDPEQGLRQAWARLVDHADNAKPKAAANQ